MSHFSKIKTKIYDLDILKKSLEDLGLEWTNDAQQVLGYKGQTHKADIIIKQANNYDIGFVWTVGKYELVTDLMFWKQPCSIEKYVNQINQRYAFNSIVQYGEKENFNVTEFKNRQDGAICLSVTQYK
jgi:hypothetical protein